MEGLARISLLGKKKKERILVTLNIQPRTREKYPAAKCSDMLENMPFYT